MENPVQRKPSFKDRSSSFKRALSFQSSSFRSNSSKGYAKVGSGNETELAPPSDSTDHHIVIDVNGGDYKGEKNLMLGKRERSGFIEKHIRNVEEDNRKMLEKIKERINKVEVKLPTVEVRYKNLTVDVRCKVVGGDPLPSLWNTTKAVFSGLTRLCGLNDEEREISIIRDASGIIKPSRMTLLLGPPGCGKTTLLLALSGKLGQSMKVEGDITYNGVKLEEFCPGKTSAYISQNDMHIPQMTVRETLDFSGRCQGIGSREDILMELQSRENSLNAPEQYIDTYMKETSVKGLPKSLQTDYVMKILGMDSCSEIMVGDAMQRGISGGQRRRLTTGEMIVGPSRVLFMDEISNGLDSSTTFQIVSCLQQSVHISEVTALVSLLQPAPETFELFDDVILMSEGIVIYHGPRDLVLDFFEDCGFKCPDRKAIADFLQEVISKKDQAQYWFYTNKPHAYVTADQFSRKFKESLNGNELEEELLTPYDKSNSHQKALAYNCYSLSKWELFKTCLAREYLLMKRDAFVYIFKTIQLGVIATITMTVFLRTHMKADLIHSNYYMGSIFYTIIRLANNGIAELAMTVSRLPVFYRQRDFYFYPAWAYSVPAFVLKIPISFIESFLWTMLTYYVIGYSPEPERLFRQFLLLFALHLMSTSLFRFLAAIFQTPPAAACAGNLALVISCLFCGFIIPRTSLPFWLEWGFWISPFTYAEIGIALNEFEAPRWKKVLSGNMTTGQEALQNHGINFRGYMYWVSVAALAGFAVFFNIGFTLALSYQQSPGKSQSIISREKLPSKKDGKKKITQKQLSRKSKITPIEVAKNTGTMVLPFTPLAIAFQDVQYFVDTPKEMREENYTKAKLQLLSDITGAFRPGILSALMGVSGAGKTTLMDVLSGRKTGGYVEGEIKIGGYSKVQETFARISGYCEQTDIHSPNVTVKESVIYSAWLRLSPEIDTETRLEFVEEVLQRIELDSIQDSLVGKPGISGLSTEQRKRLTIAVELVANPSIMFMDEPTSGLDARAAAIVMRAVKNVVNTGRTVVCTIHQPSIDIFESFDELILMKRGGKIIYSGPLGKHSSKLIEYFEDIPGIPRIARKYNPATWMLDITSPSMEKKLGIDYAQLYKISTLYRELKELVKELSEPPAGSKDLQFLTRYPQRGFEQYNACLWKQHNSYWRSSTYNMVRILYMIIISVVFGAAFWQQGRKINNEQDMFNIIGSMFLPIVFFGLNNCTTIIPIVAAERAVMYREKYAGMYSSWAYSFAQVTIEIPYILLQAFIFVVIIYPTVGYYWSLYKIIWCFYTIFCSLLCSTYLGMFLMSLSPSTEIANILTAASYTLLNLFSGYLLPRPRLPKWWVWLYWVCPTSWSLTGVITSQYGDVTQVISVYGEPKPINNMIRDYYGFQQDEKLLVGVMLIIFPITFACLFAYTTGRMNFQKR